MNGTNGRLKQKIYKSAAFLNQPLLQFGPLDEWYDILHRYIFGWVLWRGDYDRWWVEPLLVADGWVHLTKKKKKTKNRKKI